MDVLVYSGPGASQYSLDCLVTQLGAVLPPHTVKTVTAAHFDSDAWHSTTLIVMFPGGADTLFLRSFGQLDNCSEVCAGLQSIRRFVARGGSYVGFCAGAYFACSEIEFEMHNQNRISGRRPLDLVRAKAIGNIFGPTYNYEYGTERSARLVHIQLAANFHRVLGDCVADNLCVYYNGGCFFQVDKDAANVQTIATYAIGNILVLDRAIQFQERSHNVTYRRNRERTASNHFGKIRTRKSHPERSAL